MNKNELKPGLKIAQIAHPEYGVWRVVGPTKGVAGTWDLERETRRDGMVLDEGELEFWKLA